jgi:hypothetical protein
MIANRAHTRGFRAILPKVQKTMDWMVERTGFEPSRPLIGVTAKARAEVKAALDEDAVYA